MISPETICSRCHHTEAQHKHITQGGCEVRVRPNNPRGRGTMRCGCIHTDGGFDPEDLDDPSEKIDAANARRDAETRREEDI